MILLNVISTILSLQKKLLIKKIRIHIANIFCDKSASGFTLIELLFVIAIISVFATLGMALAKQYAEESKIKKAATQMQQILQAGTAYHVDHKQWPQEGNVGFKEKYISMDSMQDPWGNKYSFCPTEDSAGGSCSKNVYAGLFQVKTSATLTSSVAERIRGKLSNALIGGGLEGRKYVYTQISLEPAEPRDNVSLIKIGQATAKGKYPTPIKIDVSCPSGYISKIYLNPQKILGTEETSLKGSLPAYIYAPPFVAQHGGCNSGNGKCQPYTINVGMVATRFKCKDTLQTIGFFKRPEVHYFNCLASEPFWKEYTLNYAIYCCKVDGEDGNGEKISSYCQ